MDYEIRLAREDDALELARLKLDLWKQTYINIYPADKINNYDIDKNIKKFRDIINDPNIKLYVVVSNDKLVGYMSYGKPIRPYKNFLQEIGLLYLDKSMQKLGIGKELFNIAYDSIKNSGYEEFFISCNKYNDNARKFYEKMGGLLIDVDSDNDDKSIPQVKYLYRFNKINIDEVKTPEDILEYMKCNIRYGWLDRDNNEHIFTMKNFRKDYRTSSLDEVLEHKLGCCIEQVYLMKYLLDKINIPSKMFCTRIYENDDYDNVEESEHMHCFVLYYLNGKVYQIEHPNWEKIGIYEYTNEETAIKSINEYYVNLSSGISRPVTEFFEVKPNLSFKEFNNYINSLDIK